MRKRFKIPLTFIGTLLMMCIGLFVVYYIYLEVLTPGSIEVDAPLSINYVDSKEFSDKNYEDIRFDVTNNGTVAEYFYVSLNQVETNYDAEFILTSNKEYSLEGLVKNEQITDFILIEPGDTHEFTLNVRYENGKILSGEIVVIKEVLNNTFNEIIISNNTVIDTPLTSVAKEVATTDEGLIKEAVEGGYTYYFRGAVTSNYVSFADLLWRVVRINSDGSVKLVLNTEIETLYPYYNDSSGYEFKLSGAKIELEKWYETYLEYYSDFISNQNFCNDNSVVNSDNLTLAAYNRANVDMVASYNCLGEEINTKIGLLTIDEALYAGLSIIGGNALTYLSNENIQDDYFLMSGSSMTEFQYSPFIITSTGEISESVGTSLNGIRPVINISKNVSIEGNGTFDDPYTVLTN